MFSSIQAQISFDPFYNYLLFLSYSDTDDPELKCHWDTLYITRVSLEGKQINKNKFYSH